MDDGKLWELYRELEQTACGSDELIRRIRRMLQRLEELASMNIPVHKYMKVYEATLYSLYELIRVSEECRDMLRSAIQRFEEADCGLGFVSTGPSFAMPLPKPETAAGGNELNMRKVEFSAVAPKAMVKGDYSIIHVIMYEEAYRHIVDEVMKTMDEPVQESRSGIRTAALGSRIKVVLSSPDLQIEDDTEAGTWEGKHLDFSFAILLPEDYGKAQVLLIADVYINDVIASKLKFIVKCAASSVQETEVSRKDIASAFMSYASQDRGHVTNIIQGMQKARPDLDVFFDVDNLRSGDNWEQAIHREIERRDVLFLCWSRNAQNSEWVNNEWRYALEKKGDECIEPVPIESPDICPPPKELSHKHFNERLLYYAGKNE